MLRKPTIATGSMDWKQSRGTNPTNSEWVLRDRAALDDLGEQEHTFTCAPPTRPRRLLPAHSGNFCVVNPTKAVPRTPRTFLL